MKSCKKSTCKGTRSVKGSRRSLKGRGCKGVCRSLKKLKSKFKLKRNNVLRSNNPIKNVLMNYNPV